MPTILNVGQCAFDQRSMTAYLSKAFAAKVISASTAQEAWQQLAGSRFDLVLVNRILDRDGSSGVELVRRIKADDALSTIAVMLVSNYPEAQAEAQAIGALPGFGKGEMGTSANIESLNKVLTTRESTSETACHPVEESGR